MSGLIYHTDKRRVVPQLERKHEYLDTINVQANQNSAIKDNNRKRPILKLRSENLIQKLEEWKATNDFDLAGDIVSQAIIEDKLELLVEIKKDLKDNHPNFRIFSWLFEGNKSSIDNSKIDENIRRLKLEPKDSITWVDQAINFLEISDRNEALNCIENALAANSDLGYVVRTASRIFNLIGDNGRAIRVLKKSEYYKTDPQILSAEISFSHIENRKTDGYDIGRRLLHDKRYKSIEISELASSLGTVEYFNKEFKKSEELFDISLKDPSVNSVSQALWYKKNSISIPHYNIIESNEIKTHKFSNSMEYDKALEYALYWIKDEPYSIRPYRLASHLSGVLFEEYTKGFEIIKQGTDAQRDIKGENFLAKDELVANNDLAYFLLKQGKVEEAKKYIEPSLKLLDKSTGIDIEESVNIATLGLYSYRSGEHELGKSLYKRAINYFKQTKNFYYLSSAFLNYFEEEMRVLSDIGELNKLRKEMEDVVNENSSDDLKYQKMKLLKKFDKRLEKLK